MFNFKKLQKFLLTTKENFLSLIGYIKYEMTFIFKIENYEAKYDVKVFGRYDKKHSIRSFFIFPKIINLGLKQLNISVPLDCFDEVSCILYENTYFYDNEDKLWE